MRVLSHNGSAGGAWVVDAVALADEGERVAGELRHVAGMYVCAIALPSSETEVSRASDRSGKASSAHGQAIQQRV